MKVLIFLACWIFAVHGFSIFDRDVEDWFNFKLKYKKTYTSHEEDKFRMKIFMENKRKIEEHNAKYQKGEVSFEMEINKFSDMLNSEISQKYKGFNQNLKQRNQKQGSTFIPPANYEVPDEVNWVKKGAVTPIKNQGQCGSCWAFSATGALEGQHFRKTGTLVSLSEQNLVDCSIKEGNRGCNGGLMDRAFQYVKDNGGIDTEDSYPYEAKNDTCRYKPADSGATDTGFVDIPMYNETALQLAVASIGPVSVAIDASVPSFMHYKGGIYKDDYCTFFMLDHGVLVVGYGVDKETGEKYWLLKNSWGTDWGENGYMRMAKDEENMCGIATMASYPLV